MGGTAVIGLYRARVLFVAAAGLSCLLLVTEFPLSELLHQQSELRAVQSQLAQVDVRNASLAADIGSLELSSTVESIAHEEYGLVRPGQLAFALLRTARAGTSVVAVALQQHRLPSVDLVAPPADSLGLTNGTPHARAGTPSTSSIWSRVVDRLAFWRWVF